VDQTALDRLCDELRSRRSSLGEAATELARLRDTGYSIVESSYIICKVFEIPLGEAKTLAIAGESSEQIAEIDAFHESLEKGVQGSPDR
jgi:hypothetical protein